MLDLVDFFDWSRPEGALFFALEMPAPERVRDVGSITRSPSRSVLAALRLFAIPPPRELRAAPEGFF